MLRHVGLVMVPGLRALHENVGIRLEPARIVEGADAKADEVGASPNLNVERRAAITAENADDVVAAVRLRNVAAWCALEDEGRCTRKARGGDVRGTTLALAVAAMTAKGEDRFAHGLVADCATEAAACSGVGHSWSPPGQGIGGQRQRKRNGPGDRALQSVRNG